MKEPKEIIVVSGLPRSGTSMMMQMLAAGGVPVLADTHRKTDESNPKGYLEYEPVKRLSRDVSWLNEAEGKAVKIIAQLLSHLPDAYTYRVILMERDIDEVLASQEAMLARMGNPGAAAGYAVLKRAFGAQIERAKQFLESSENIRFTTMTYRDVIAAPEEAARDVAAFLDRDLDTARMARAVDADLYRTRTRP